MRVDPDSSHSYPLVSRVDAGEPACPYALHLTNEDHQFEFIVFDLDVARESLAGVWRDADTITTLLAEQGLDHMVSRSGPGGGIHVWVPVSDEHGLDPVEVARLARAAEHSLPTLDIAPLLNPATGAVRPPGAPHRAGGCAELLHPLTAEDALLVCDTATNTAQRFEHLAVALGAEELDIEETTAADTAAERIDPVAVRLHGRRAPMPDMVRHLLDTPSGEDPSAHVARILPRLALARWSLADVQRLVEETEQAAPGLEHLRSRRFGTGRRRRPETEQAALLTRQWTKAVAFAARLAPGVERAERDLLALRGIGAAVLEVVAERPELWTVEAGPADQRTLLGVLGVALTACAEDGEVDIDIRRLALATGLGKSTVARALHRLRRDGRLVQVAGAEGTQAARWRLVHPDQWTDVSPGRAGGTQGEPAPPLDPHPEGYLATREDLLHRIHVHLEVVSHEVFAEHSPTHPRGLGRHVARTYAALVEKVPHLYSVDIQTLSRLTGDTPARTARHLRLLAQQGLIDPDTGLPTGADALDEAAIRLGTTGVHAARERRYTAEREAFADWHAELARLRAPVALRPRVAERYARTLSGRPDHAAQLARHLVAA